MNAAENIENLIKKFYETKKSSVTTSNEVDKKVLNDALAVYEKSNNTESANLQPNVWRIIMKTRMTKLVAAAVIIIAVILSMNLLDKSVTPAYAIEQTIEAFKNVRFLHLIRHDEAGQIEDERWIELGMDGRQVKYRQEKPDWLDVEDGKTTAVYYKDKKTVVLYDGKDMQYQWIGSLGKFLENLRQEGQVIEENANYNGQIAHRVLWPKMNAECYVDPVTKLPIAIGNTELSYEQPPVGIFEITIPENYAVVDKRRGAAPADEPDWLSNQHTANKYFHQARYALTWGEYDKAAELFEYVIEKQPGRNWAWFWLGKTYYEQGEYDSAIEKFSKAIEMTGGTYALYARGLAYAQNGMEEAAREDLLKALAWMIQALRKPTAATMFEYADNPRLRDGGYRPTEKQILACMINRLRIITGQNFGYDPDASAEENEQPIVAWEEWYENSGKIEFTPDAELIPVPEVAK